MAGSVSPAVRKAKAGGCGSTGRRSRAAARTGASSSSGGPDAKASRSANPAAPAVSAARIAKGWLPFSSTGVPRRNSAAAR